MTPRAKSSTFSWYEAAKMLGITQASLINFLRHMGDVTGQPAMATRQRLAEGYFELQNGSFEIVGGPRKNYVQTRVTIQGLAWLERYIKSGPSPIAA